MAHIPDLTDVFRGASTCLGVGSRDRASLSECPHMLESRGKKAFVRPLFDVPQVGVHTTLSRCSNGWSATGSYSRTGPMASSEPGAPRSRCHASLPPA